MTFASVAAPRRHVRRLAGVLAALAALVAITGGAVALQAAGVFEEVPFSHEKERHFDRRADAPRRGDLAFVLPDWVPRDARDVDLRVKTTGEGAVMRLSTAHRTPPAGCVRLSGGGRGGRPVLDAKWFPSAVAGRATLRCNAWVVAPRGGTWYAWMVNG